MVNLALRQDEGPVQLGMIAEKEGVSEKYLEHLFRQLKASGLVLSHRGARGGYILARKPEEITLFDIVRALEGSLAPVDCLNQANLCNRSPFCATREVWAGLRERIESYLKSKTLLELAQEQKEKTSVFVYHI
jgi:Rrf2 family protein